MPDDLFTPLDGQPWSTERMARQSPTWASSGVIGTPASAYGSGAGALSFAVAGSAITVGLSLFRAVVRGFLYERANNPWQSGLTGTQPTPGTATYALNSNSNPRIDRLVLRRDLAALTIYPVIIVGTPAATPTKPALTQSETGVWDIPLHSWQLAGSNSTSISNIVDERAWVDPSGGRAPACWSTAARDANFLSPQQGDTVQIASDGSTHVRDGSTWAVWDSRWQTYTPEFSASPSPPFIAGDIQDGIVAGRYFRRGRINELSLFFRIGISTTYLGATSVVRFGYPAGLSPADSNYLNNFGHADGTAYAGTTAGDLMLFVIHDYQATAANRRMFLLDGTQRSLQGGGGAINLQGGGRFAQFTTSYEIA